MDQAIPTILLRPYWDLYDTTWEAAPVRVLPQRIQDLDLNGNIAMGSADAAKLNLKDGDTVSVESRWGVIKRKIDRSSRMRPGQVFVPLAVNANDAMNLFDLTDLADPNATGWKTCAVKIKKI